MTAPIARTWTQEDWTDFVHTGHDSLCGQYFRKFWQPVAVGEDLLPGTAKPIRILSEDFTVYRGESGVAHLLAFRCAHRGTQLSTGWVEGDELRCFYHGWKYNGQGQCTEQPAEPEPFCNRIRIKSYPTQEYLGLIFAYLGDGEAPPMRRFLHMEGEGFIEARWGTVWPCNYLNRMDNDPAHVPFVHRVGPLAASGLWQIPRFTRCEETDYGMVAHTERPNGHSDGRYQLLPNLQEFFAGRPGLSMTWVIPIDDTHHTSVTTRLILLQGEELAAYQEQRQAQRNNHRRQQEVLELGEACLRGELHVDEVGADRSTWDILTNVQDYASQVGQGIIPDIRQDHLGRTDVLVSLWRRMLARELCALAEGRSMKEYWSQVVPPLLYKDLSGRASAV